MTARADKRTSALRTKQAFTSSSRRNQGSRWECPLPENLVHGELIIRLRNAVIPHTYHAAAISETLVDTLVIIHSELDGSTSCS